jgi:hypothetical protein
MLRMVPLPSKARGGFEAQAAASLSRPSWPAPSSSVSTPSNSSSCSRLVALAIGAATPGWAASQARETWAGVAPVSAGDLVERGEDAQAALVKIGAHPVAADALSEIGLGPVLAGEEARGEPEIRQHRRRRARRRDPAAPLRSGRGASDYIRAAAPRSAPAPRAPRCRAPRPAARRSSWRRRARAPCRPAPAGRTRPGSRRAGSSHRPGGRNRDRSPRPRAAAATRPPRRRCAPAELRRPPTGSMPTLVAIITPLLPPRRFSHSPSRVSDSPPCGPAPRPNRRRRCRSSSRRPRRSGRGAGTPPRPTTVQPKTLPPSTSRGVASPLRPKGLMSIRRVPFP